MLAKDFFTFSKTSGFMAQLSEVSDGGCQEKPDHLKVEMVAGCPVLFQGSAQEETGRWSVSHYKQ